MEKAKIRVTRGITVEVNDAGETITIDADDQMFIDRFYKLIDDLEQVAEEVDSDAARKLGDRERLNLMINRTKTIMAQMDALFGAGCCRKVFGDAIPSPYGLADMNSPLVSYTQISPNRTSPRNHKIDTITIHCMACDLSVERCGAVFAKRTRMASSNYGVGSDGRIAMYVEEKDRSWCSSNRANDHRAITIEVACEPVHPYKVTDAALAALINLLEDICRRNDIKQLLWKGDKSLIGQVDRQNMTVHRWFAKKACPGDYLYGKHAYIASEVNKRLGVEAEQQEPVQQPSATGAYKVRITAGTLNVRAGAGTGYRITTTVKKGGIYTITAEQNGWGRLKSGAGWISLKYTEKL